MSLSGVVIIHFINGEIFESEDGLSENEVYISVIFGRKSQKTKTLKNVTSLTLDESFIFHLIY
jgi:hypothetical protein